ncbi:MAG: hypothetical protein F6J92_18870 [Symploca sp. SIO1A3]|nr:hypothetical protein [Symploca sp. SIO1A3]
MSKSKKRIRILQKLIRQMGQFSRLITKQLMQLLLRSLLVLGRRSRRARAGFVLPTVVMVSLVVILLTTAIMIRSFDRTRNASNYRVNQAVLNASEPALERAKRKLDKLFESPNLRGTPAELNLNSELQPTWDAINNEVDDQFTFADETRLELAFDINGSNAIDNVPTAALIDKEQITNAWRFPVDTDNDGLLDSFTLYSILFRSPSRNANGEFDRQRNPLEARTPPMDEGSAGGACAAAFGTSASLVGGSDWYQSGGNLKKSFFIHVATVPITDLDNPGDLGINAADVGNYETFTGNRGFSALEYQQDRIQIPPANNAILYEDDLTVFAGSAFRVNGRVFTNSNLFGLSFANNDPNRNIHLFQVSSPASCFYQPENGKVVVAGNTAYGRPIDTGGQANNGNAVLVDLFNPGLNPGGAIATEDFGKVQQSVTQEPSEIAYNTAAYEQRIEKLVTDAVTNLAEADDPQEVQVKQQQLIDELIANGVVVGVAETAEARRQAMEIYFRNRTRRVSYGEVPFAPTLPAPTLTYQGIGDTLRPPDEWMYPFDPADGATGATYSELALKQNGTKLLPPATSPDDPAVVDGTENLLGDRVLVGNNLPALWYDDPLFVGNEETQNIVGTEWDAGPAADNPRKRRTQAEPINDLDITNRDGFWEQKATERPSDPLVGIGGVRLVTSAGVYLPEDDSSTGSFVVWPDTMPQPGNVFNDDKVFDRGTALDDVTSTRPYLKMRATAVYQYNVGGGRTPIACVASFYDPTNRITANNREDLTALTSVLNPDGGNVSGEKQDNYFDPITQTIADARIPTNVDGANSVNGITFGPPTVAQGTVAPYLTYLAQQVYPNGRNVNPLLRQAYDKDPAWATGLTLAEQGAVDSTICALQIYGKTRLDPVTRVETPDTGTWGDIQAPTETPKAGFQLPHGAIKEVSFLDARQIKSSDQGYDPATFDTATKVSTTTGLLDLPIEQRQPLEIRATELDLDLLRQSQADSAGGPQEYMIPNSGIIYATRDDALPDQTALNAAATGANLKVSASDFRLDPTRRPNGIVLINGERLGRDATFRRVEKGFILASNLPVYVKGDFNKHQQEGTNTEVEEFTAALADDWNNFYARALPLEDDFACRAGDPRLPTDKCENGDDWRSATILSDAMTLLSDEFRYGFRDEGDFDLRNNRIDNIEDPDGIAPVDVDAAATIAQKRLDNGFFNNDFVTNGLSSGGFDFLQDSISPGVPTADVTPTDDLYSQNEADAIGSSYFNNAVTPIQRRVVAANAADNFPEFVMEICRKLPVSECGAGDWVVGAAGAGTKASGVIGQDTNALVSGTTASPPPDPKDRHFPRRVAFQRAGNNLVLDGGGNPTILGINGAGKVQAYPYAAYGGANRPRLQPNALWYRGQGNNFSFNDPPDFLGTLIADGSQPQLVPVLQLQATTENRNNSGPAEVGDFNGNDSVRDTNWLQRAITDTTFNMVMATGDTPSHPRGSGFEAEFNGGVANLPHLLQNWRDLTNNQVTTQISGSFIQFKRASYATAPFWQIPKDLATDVPGNPYGNAALGGPFNYVQVYATGNGSGRVPSYEQPVRQWGFDVGLLSQAPDLFSNQFSVSFRGLPNEFFRETSRDDDWVRSLLCSKPLEFQVEATPRDFGTITANAINDDQRPTDYCQRTTGT